MRIINVQRMKKESSGCLEISVLRGSGSLTLPRDTRESLRIQMSFQNGAENADERRRNLKNGHESLVSSHGLIKVELPP